MVIRLLILLKFAQSVMKFAHFFTFSCFLALFFLSFGLCVTQESGQPRLAPGSLIVIPPDVDYENTYYQADLPELIEASPRLDSTLTDDIRFNKEFYAEGIRFQRDVWCLQFSFKPVRIIEVDVPNKEGTFDKKAIWYLVYNVKNVGPTEVEEIEVEGADSEDEENGRVRKEFVLTNPGGAIGTTIDTVSAIAQDDPLVLQNMPGTFKPGQGKDEPIQFVPQFIFAIDQLGTIVNNDPQTGKRTAKPDKISISYVDQIIPIAIPAIMKREGMEAIPRTTVSIAREELKAGEDVWGVAMWTDIDPRVHRFSIYVSGLTNVYRWNDPVIGDDRIRDQKVLKINWWRHGDQFNLSDKEIQYGFPGWRRDELVEKLHQESLSIRDLAEMQVRPFVEEMTSIYAQLDKDKDLLEEDKKERLFDELSRKLSKEELTEILKRYTDQEIRYLLFQGELDYEWVFR